MPIKVIKNLPAITKLAQENIFVMDTERAESQQIRPLHILLVNLMPTKEVTETQILRALSNSPLQVNLTLLHKKSLRILMRRIWIRFIVPLTKCETSSLME